MDGTVGSEGKGHLSFLHNLKGTAGTVGLPDVEQFAEDTLPYFMESSLKSWSVEEWGIIYIH